jgi:hypothetical protein
MAGFLRTNGRHIVDEDGNRLLLRGVGLGNWLLPEGYMWRLPAAADRPRRMELLVKRLVGADDAERFWQQYRDRFICEDDIATLAACGYNSIRLPLNARTILSDPQTNGASAHALLNEQEMERVDRLIRWCREHGIYVVLDLHGAPGGQTGTNIDDSEYDQPELFQREECAELTIDLWRALAKRYADEWIVAGYDLLNEPLPNWFSQYNHQVLPFYRKITEAIRSMDRRHTIILEGVHWATDWSIFTERIDDNLILQFHKYWNNPDRESLSPYLAMRESWDVPIFMGEGGENNADWYAGAFRLYDDLDISWNFWTWKKMDTTNSPLSIRPPAGWSRIGDAAENGTDVPRQEATRILDEYLLNIESRNCDHNPAVTNALFRRPPVRVPAIFYVNAPAGEGFFTPKPVPEEQTPRFRATDHMPMAFVEREGMPTLTEAAPAFDHNGGEPWSPDDLIGVRIDAGAWVSYDIEIPAAGSFRFALSCRADRAATAELVSQDTTVDLCLSGDTRTEFVTTAVALTSGLRRLTVRCRKGSLFLVSITCTADTGEV